MAVHWGGILAIVVFYVMILLVGLWAARKSKSSEADPDSEDVMLAGRNIGLVVGIFTMTGKEKEFTLIFLCISFILPDKIIMLSEHPLAVLKTRKNLPIVLRTTRSEKWVVPTESKLPILTKTGHFKWKWLEKMKHWCF